MSNKNAYDELIEFLDDEETVEGVVFGVFGWSGFDEPDEAKIPENMRGIVLSIDQAKPFMKGWSFYGGHGAPMCYAITVWTNENVIFVSQYDGSTRLESVPRNPVDHDPEMPGG